MKELALFAEIEQSEILNATPTAYDAGIWRYSLYATGKLLPFMKDTFNRTPIEVNNLIVDNEEFMELESIQDLYGDKKLARERGGWVNEGSVIYVRFPFYNPPFLHYSFSYGVLTGFTDNKPAIIDGVAYRPGLLSSPQVEQSADAYTYKRMKFNTASVTIDNSKGQFDELKDTRRLFGNEFNVLVGIIPEDEKEKPQRRVKLLEEAENKQVVAVKKTDEYITLIGKDKKKPKPEIWKLAQYYIENITAGLETATFHLKDKRERLAAKIPNRQYTREEYEYIDDKYIGQDMQEAYGKCFGVPGICLEGKRIFIDKNNPSLGKWEQYRFRFSSEISRIDRIQVKMTSGEIKGDKTFDGWTTVYNGEWKPGILTGDLSEASNGIISLSYAVAKEGGDYEKRINEVRMDGVFNNPGKKDVLQPNIFVTPLDIILDIMNKYANVPHDQQRYYFTPENKSEIQDELSQLDNFEIGVLFDKSVLVYEAIEKLQNGSVLGFQFVVYKDLFTARLDNPNRTTSCEIRNTDILHLDRVEIDWNADLYGSYTDIEYAYNYYEGNGKRWIDKEKRQKILSIHRQEKDWSVKTLLAKEEDAQKKSDILLEDFSTLQPLIKNIHLSGKKWFNMRVYDIVEIDFSIPGEEREKYPHHIIKLISEVGNGRLVTIGRETDEYVTLINDKKETTGQRDFVGELRCEILRVVLNTGTGVTTIDVRVKNESAHWPKP